MRSCGSWRLGTRQGQHFVKNGDGTVTDTNTGLMWQQVTKGEMDWEEALTSCEGDTFAGYDDWRLPNRNELQSLLDYTWYDPSADQDFFGDAVPTYYWSSTTKAGEAETSLMVSFFPWKPGLCL